MNMHAYIALNKKKKSLCQEFHLTILLRSDGQAVWFMKYHAEKLPSAVERYQKEALRVVKVRDTFLRENKKQYLVGDKLTYADIAFVPWDLSVFGFIITPEMADVEKVSCSLHPSSIFLSSQSWKFLVIKALRRMSLLLVVTKILTFGQERMCTDERLIYRNFPISLLGTRGLSPDLR